MNLIENVVSMIVSHSQANRIDQVNERLEYAASKFVGDSFSGSLDDDVEDIIKLYEDEKASLSNGHEESNVISDSPKTSVETTIPDKGTKEQNEEMYRCPVTDCGATTKTFPPHQQAALIKHVVLEHLDFDLQKCVVCERNNVAFHFRLFSTFFEHHAQLHSRAVKKAKPLTLTAEQQERLTHLVNSLDQYLSEKSVIEDIAWNNLAAILRNASSQSK